MKLVKRFLSELTYWAFYFPLFKSGKIEKLDIINYQGESFEVFTTRTLFFSKRLYSVSKVPEQEDTSWREHLNPQEVIVIVKNLGDVGLEEFQATHKALKKFNPKLNLHMQF